MADSEDSTRPQFGNRFLSDPSKIGKYSGNSLLIALEIRIKDISFRYDLNSSACLLPIFAFQSFYHVFCSARSCDYFVF